MAFFGGSGPSAAEIQQADIIKPSLTSKLKEVVKQLQKQHVNSEEAIHSEDTANAVCNVLEAIFLHGLKSSFSKKVTSFVSGIDEDKDYTFWEFVRLFSHRDTVSNLNRLGQITTQVGMCRAWIRLALNDGLLESYITAMLRDKKTLLNHYRRIAYLRDPEQPEIMKSYVQGIANFTFELSYNSSVLNIWTTTPLALSGLIDTQMTPEAVVRPAQAEEALPDLLMPSNIMAPTNNPTINDAGLANIHSQYPYDNGLQNEQYHDSSGLSQKEIEQIYQINERIKSSNHSDDSFGTAASQISMPDPRDMREFPQDTMSPKHVKISEGYSKIHANTTNDVEFAGVKAKRKNLPKDKIKKKKKKKKKVLPIPENLAKSSDGVDSISFTSVHSDDVGSFKSLNTWLSGEEPVVNLKDEYDIISTDGEVTNSDKHNRKLNLNTDQRNADSHDNIILPQKDSVSANKLVERPNEFQDCLVKNSDTDYSDDFYSSKQPHRNIDSPEEYQEVKLTEPELRDMNLPSDSSVTVGKAQNNAPINGNNSIKDFSSTKKGEPLIPELSKAVAIASSVEEAEEAENAQEFYNSSEANDPSSQVPQTCTLQREDTKPRNSHRQQSNSLNQSLTLGGWSSPIDYDEQEEENSVYLTNSVEGDFPDLSIAIKDNIPRPSAKQDNGSELWSVNTTDKTPDTIPGIDQSHASSSPSKSGQDLTESIYLFYKDFEILHESEVTGLLEDSGVLEFKELLGEIVNEKGLDLQNFQCYGCKRSVGMFFCQPRICTFDGANYCYECHENEEFYIPIKVILNWDFRKHLVCKKNLALLRQFEDSPLLNVFQINSRIYDHVKVMEEVKNLRQQLRYLKAYLFTCKQSTAEEFRQQLWPKEYLYDDLHLYSLLDLLQVASGQLALLLRKVCKLASQHVYKCGLCSQKGFICEICNSPKVIYPFEMESTKKCGNCDAVYHKSCKTNMVKCPKCHRLMQRQIKMGKRATISSNDYAFAPDKSLVNSVSVDEMYQNNSSLQAGST